MLSEQEPTPRFFFLDGTDEAAAFKAGLLWLMKNGGGAIVLPALTNLSQIEAVLGAQHTATLKKHKELASPRGNLKLFTQRTMPSSFHGPLLSIWPTEKVLEKTHAIMVCVICKSEDEVAGWIRDFNPLDLLTSKPVRQQPTLKNPVVIAALESLTERVTRGAALSNPFERDSAISMFRILVGAGLRFESEQVSSWAVAHGWQPKEARALTAMSEKILSGQKMRAKSRWSDDALDAWHRKAQGERF